MVKEAKKTIQWVQEKDTCHYGFLTKHPYTCQGSPYINMIQVNMANGNAVPQEDAVKFSVPGNYLEYSIEFCFPESEKALVSALVQASLATLSEPPSSDGECTLILGSERNKETFTPSLEAMLNVVDGFAPMPDDIKISIAKTCGLDTSHLIKGTAAANVCYVTRMARQVSRGHNDIFPKELIVHIGTLADSNHILSSQEAIKATNAGYETPATVEIAQKATKGEFTKKVLDKYLSDYKNTGLSK